MKQVAWLTDIHLNFLTAEGVDAFLAELVAAAPDAVLLGGDISEWPEVTRELRRLAERLGRPIYFVLGNHDYYHGSIRDVRAAVSDLCERTPGLAWLNESSAIQLAPGVGLVGCDGWADARWGDYDRSQVMLNDYRLIDELAAVDKPARRAVLAQLGEEAAAHIRRVLPRALDEHAEVLLLTHVPPFREACLYEGKISDDEWLPHFASKAMGDALLEIMSARPDRRLTVLCGHTHCRAEVRPLANVLVLTGGAEYRAPEIQRMFEFA